VDPLAGLRRYAADWWWPTLVPWFLILFVDLALLGMRLRTFAPWTLVVLDACHHVRLLSPLLGWASARAALRRASLTPRRASWLLTGTAPWWSLTIALCGIVVSVFSWMMLSAPSYLGFLIAPPMFVIGRIGLEILWFRRCFREASRVALLEVSDDEASERAFRLQPLDGQAKDVIVREYDDLSASVYLMEGDSEVLWKAVGSLEGLGAAIRASGTGKSRKTKDV
jgi:hypothetical protein